MTGRSERIVRYTMDEIKEHVAKGHDRTNHGMSHEEAMRRRQADPEAPRPYEGWEETIIAGLPEPKKQMTLRLDADVVQWFRAQGKGYQTLMNAVLKGYVDHQRGGNRNRDGNR